MRLRALIVEDEDADELLLLRALVREGFEVAHRRVETRGQMIAALTAEKFDIIFCDWRLPEFGAMAAIQVATKYGPGIPILIVSGSIGEEAAVEALRAGATDFVNKDKLSRLGPAIRRELRDVATRRSRERLERQLLAIFENSLDAMLLADDEGRFVEANPAACELLGVERERLLAMRISEVVPSAPGPFAGARTGFVAHGRESGVVELRRGDERLVTVEYNAIGEVLPGVHLSVLRDVTERQQLRARLALADRLAAIGTIAAGVVHEINNPLTFVAANASHVLEILERNLVLDPALGRECLRDVMEGVERIRTIVQDVRTFARGDGDRLTDVDVNRVLASSLRIAGAHMRRRAVAVLEPGIVRPVRATESRLGQVFLNLIVNAAQAMPDRDPALNTITLRSSTRGDEVVVQVIDAGTGISPEHLPLLFTPFFTTKPMETGTGLGLVLCRDIVHSLGGRIEVESVVDQGTTFSVVLPAADVVPRRSEDELSTAIG